MAESGSGASMRCEVSLVKIRPVKVAPLTSSSMQPACPVRVRFSGSRNEKTRPRFRQPGLLVCRKEGLIAHECKRGATERDRRESPYLLGAPAARRDRHVHFLPLRNGFV